MAVFDSAKVDQPSLPNPWIRTSLYVGDLDEKVSPTDLFHVFSEIGKVSSVHLCVHALTGDSLRYGYVNFLFPMDASRALSSLNHTKLKGKPMRIMWCQRNPYPRRVGFTNLFVKNLDPDVTSAHLESMFKGFRTIFSCKVVEEDGKSKGFGFVHFEDEASVTAAMSAMHDKMLGGKKLYVARFMSKSQRIASNDEKFTNLYVKNLDESLTDDNLREKFSEFGTVCNAVIMRDGEGKPNINYASPEEAKKAVAALNGAEFGSKKLFVGRAQKKAEILKCEREGMKIFEDKARESNVYVKKRKLGKMLILLLLLCLLPVATAMAEGRGRKGKATPVATATAECAELGKAVMDSTYSAWVILKHIGLLLVLIFGIAFVHGLYKLIICKELYH